MGKGMGGVRKVGEEGAGQAGFQRWQEAERVGEIYATLDTTFRVEKAQRGRSQQL